MNHLVALFATALALGACSPRTSQPAAAPGAPTPPHAQAGHHGSAEMQHGHGMMKHGAMSDGMMGPRKGQHCPMSLEGTTARVEETQGGAALIFSTSGDVAELRRRVTAMAQMHNEHAGQGCPMMGMHGTPPRAEPSTPVDHDAHHPKSDAKSPPPP